NERPLVVVCAPLVDLDRFVFALAADAGESTRNGAAHRGRAGRLIRRGGRKTCRWRKARRGRDTRRGLSGASGLTGGALSAARRDSRHRRAGAEEIEVVVRDRVFVFLAKKVALHEGVDAGGKRAGLGLIQTDRADVLLTAPDQLVFLLPLRFVSPD